MAEEIYKIFGPPGTGKTTKMLKLLAGELERGIEPRQVVYLSFTRNAVAEARSRALAKFPGLTDDDLNYFRTMHSIAYRVLGLRPDRVAAGKVLFEFGETVGYPFDNPKNFVDPDEIMFGDSAGGEVGLGSYLLSIWDYIRQNLWDLDQGIKAYPQMMFHPELRSRGPAQIVLSDFVKKYEDWKQQNNFLDYTDFLIKVVRYGQRLWPPATVIFADEVQDFSPLQWRVLKLWAGQHEDGDEVERLFLAADDDQAIFTFQGASPNLFLEYEADVEKVLSQSWRLPKAVWEYSRKLIEKNRNRKQKEFGYYQDGGTVESIPGFEDIFDELEATVKSGDSWFCLTRHRYQLGDIEAKLQRRFIPYINRRGWSPFADKRLIQACETAVAIKSGEAIITLSELSHLAQDYIPSQHSISKEWLIVRGGKKLLEEKATDSPTAVITRNDLTQFGFTQHFFDALEQNPLALLKFKSEEHRNYIAGSYDQFGPVVFKAAKNITLSTIHGAKGEEAHNVVLFSDVSKKCYEGMYKDPEAERRVFYVGATRARQNLFLVQPQTNKFYPL